jgi:hypothetical protein
VQNQVNVVATISQAVAGKTVFFKSFDMDDPSSDTAPIDPMGRNGDDNRGMPIGTLGAMSANTDASGKATVTFTTTKQPGDNFKVAASCDNNYLTGVRLKPGDGSIINDMSGAALPTASGKLTQMLTVWRKVHIERDAMQASAHNFYQGTINRVTGNASISFVSTSVIGMDPGRLQNGRLVIPDLPGSFLILSNTGSLLFISGQVPAAAVNKNFTAYDDDDFNDNDGNNKKGDTGESISLPDIGLLFDSDMPANNVFARAYVRPAYDLNNPTNNPNPNPPFVLNPLQDTLPATLSLWRFDNRASISDDYWVIYLLGAYQPSTDNDLDPDTDEGGFGITWPGTGGSTEFMEIVSAHELAEQDKSIDKDPKLADCANREIYKASIRSAPVAAHEVGHLFDGDHPDKGLMGGSCKETTSLIFSDETIDKIRDTKRPTGLR